uniref:RPW8 domain-containing protein n=1 Tax=Salix viminalis TaxID=40686 RepID=A0A6N2N9M4_SALVM
MVVADLFVGGIATELLKTLFTISRKSYPCKSSAESLMASVNELLPIIEEIKYSGVELPFNRQFQLDALSRTLTEGLELSRKVSASNRWNVYKNLQLSRKMEKMQKKISTFINGPLQAHILADVHHMRFETTERFDKMEWSAKRLEERIGNLKIGLGGGGGAGAGGWVGEAVKRVEEERNWDGSFEHNFNLGLGIEEGKRKVKEMVFEKEIFNVVGICGIGGSGKTTLANEICRDDQVRRHFENRILFLTVSQSPNVEQLRAKIFGFITGADGMGGMGNDLVPNRDFQFEWRVGARTLIVLDDVWSLKVLEQLIFKVAGCKTLVVSRFKFPTVFKATYNVELLRGDEAISLFCHSAFGKTSIPPAADSDLVKQIVDECKALPLALKVIGASLRDQPEICWASAKKRLSRGEPICESHESKLLDRMAISTQFLSKKVRECFFDLGSFPEDKKIPLDVLINVWVEIHDLDDEEAFAILVELSDKNLLTLVRDARAGDKYSSFYEIGVMQHDVLRDLAIHLSSREDVNECKRLLMPRREEQLPREWERNADRPFNAQIVSIHTGEMKEMDWFRMDFPKAEVLVLNFSANEFFLPPFIDDMPRLRALVVINYSASNATIGNLSVFSNLANLKSLWLEKVSVSQLSEFTIPLKKIRKMSLILCKIHNSLEESVVDLSQKFPCLSELTIDHCEDLIQLPSSISRMQSLKSLSITNCHNLEKLPPYLGNLKSLQILRLSACPSLKMLPPCTSDLASLKFLDISQCVNLKALPEGIGNLSRLEKIDMRECLLVKLPYSAASLQSLRAVICDEDVSWLWKELKGVNLDVQVAEKCLISGLA